MYPDIEHRDFYPLFNGLSKNIKKDYLRNLGPRGPIKLHESTTPHTPSLPSFKKFIGKHLCNILNILFFSFQILSLVRLIAGGGVVRKAMGYDEVLLD